MADKIYFERSALTRSPIPPAIPSGATIQKPMQGLGNPGDPGVGSTKAGDGLNVTGLTAVIVSLWANPGATITGGANNFLDCWCWNPDEFVRNGGVAGWSRCIALDLTVQWVSSGSTTVRNSMTFATIRNPARFGQRLLWVPNGIVVSAGTDILVRADGFISYFAS